MTSQTMFGCEIVASWSDSNQVAPEPQQHNNNNNNNTAMTTRSQTATTTTVVTKCNDNQNRRLFSPINIPTT